ncbi:hypothetical protein L2737_06330 [Shewanella electrodiphila]|uniref:Uncharacterized protein n=1 Tax=Shewanella electrodiphila TaxID=934143 RepID=A0ABT0KNL6_9GAMM|nr:hypothetical protein [Shewanella electrodiphila]MCL1044945.1 hypothetical protein [Shewanella electrodiphila]
MLNLEDISPDPVKIRQLKSRFHYLQLLYVFLVFSIGISEFSIYFSPISGLTAIALAYLFRYINKPIFPLKAWSVIKLTIFCLMAISLGISEE